MNSRALYRVRDIKASIVHIRSLLAGKSFDEMYSNAVVRAAFERFLEILSEASRSVPAEWKTQFGPAVPWRQIADLGNFFAINITERMRRCFGRSTRAISMCSRTRLTPSSPSTAVPRVPPRPRAPAPYPCG